MRRVLVVIAFLALPFPAAAADAPRTVKHEIRLHLDPRSRAVRVEDRFTIEAEAAVVFRLAPWLALVAARVDGATVAAERAGDRVTVPVAAAGPHAVEVELRGTVPELPGPDARNGAAGAVAGAEGAYLPAHAAWSADTGHARVDYELTVETPAAYRAVATGRLAEERIDGDTYRAVFASDRPSEPPSVFAGPYVVAERRDEGLRVRTYFHPELAPLAETYLEATAAHIRRYAARIGPYPYADFHVVSAPLPVGLGFPNLTYVGRRVLPLPFMRGRSLAHEVLHSWWGGAVAVDYERGNWAEGLTTYLADYELATEQGAEPAREMRLGWLQNFAALPADRDMPVDRFTAKRHDAGQVIGYDKVAFVFRMLEAELGGPAFDAGLRRFWQDRRFRVAAWADLRAAFEAAAGRDLAWFFDQWLRRAGAPRVELVEAARADDASDHRVRLTFRQSAPAYRLRLPVAIETPDGSRRHEVILEGREQDFELAVEDRPLAVHIDPDFDVFRRLLAGESPPIFRDVTLSGDTVLVLPTADAGLAETAARLAERLLQRRPEVRQGDPRDLREVPVLAIGASADIAALRARTGPFGQSVEAADAVLDAGTARAWAERRHDGQPWLFVAADDAAALEAVARPLPHYRNRSYVVFDGAKAVRKGLWRARTSPLSRRFGG